MTDNLLVLACGLAKRGYSLYIPTNDKSNYFSFSNGQRIFSAQSDLITGLTCSICYVPNRAHGSSLRIATIRNDNYNIAYKAVEKYSSITIESLNSELNSNLRKNKFNVKLYENEEKWWESYHFKSMYDNYKKATLNQLKRGYCKESFTKVIVECDNEAFEISIDFYHGLDDLNKTISTYIFNRNFAHYQGKNVNLLLLQNGKYVLTNVKTILL